MCLCVGCTHILLLLFLSHSSVCHLLSGVHHSDFTVRCSNFSRSKYATSTEHTDIEREGVRKRASARVCPHRAMEWKGATNRLTHTRIHTKRFTTIRASTSWTLFRNAFEIKRDGNNLKRMHAARLWWFTVPIMLLGVFLRWQQQRRRRRRRWRRQYWQRAPDSTARVWVPTTLSSLHNLKRNEGYVYAIPFYT